MINESLMDKVLNPENISRTREKAERYVSAVYPAPDVNKAAKRTIIRGLGSAIIGAIPYALGAKNFGRTIATAGTWNASKMFAQEQARAEAHKELFTNVLGKMLDMQAQTYLMQEQDTDRKQRFENFLNMFQQIIGNANKLNTQQLAGALVGAAVDSGLDASQIDMLNKVMGLSSKIASNNDFVRKFMVIPPGGIGAAFDAQGNIIRQIINPRQPAPPDPYKQANTEMILAKLANMAKQEAISTLAMSPEYSGYLINLGKGAINWKPDTPPEIIKKFNRDVNALVAQSLGHITPGNPSNSPIIPNPESRPKSNNTTDPLFEALGLSENKKEKEEPGFIDEVGNELDRFLTWLGGGE